MSQGQDLQYWSIVPATGPVVEVIGEPILRHCEWMRLLVGRCLPLAQRTADGWCYLVSGIPLRQMEVLRDPEGGDRLREAVRADFAVLEQAVRLHRERIHDGSLDLSRCLTGYVFLARLRLPADPRCWIVTDEGLSVVQWGLAGGRHLLDWSDDQIHVERDRVLQQIDAVLRKTGRGIAPMDSRNGSGEREVHAAVVADPSAYSRMEGLARGASGDAPSTARVAEETSAGGGPRGFSPTTAAGSEAISRRRSNGSGLAEVLRKPVPVYQVLLAMLVVLATAILVGLAVGSAVSGSAQGDEASDRRGGSIAPAERGRSDTGRDGRGQLDRGTSPLAGVGRSSACLVAAAIHDRDQRSLVPAVGGVRTL